MLIQATGLDGTVSTIDSNEAVVVHGVDAVGNYLGLVDAALAHSVVPRAPRVPGSVWDAAGRRWIAPVTAEQLRAQRDWRLLASDWTQAPDAPLDEATRAAWAAYRQALRDMPEQAGFPAEAEWPTAPG